MRALSALSYVRACEVFLRASKLLKTLFLSLRKTIKGEGRMVAKCCQCQWFVWIATRSVFSGVSINSLPYLAKRNYLVATPPAITCDKSIHPSLS